MIFLEFCLATFCNDFSQFKKFRILVDRIDDCAYHIHDFWGMRTKTGRAFQQQQRRMTKRLELELVVRIFIEICIQDSFTIIVELEENLNFNLNFNVNHVIFSLSHLISPMTFSILLLRSHRKCTLGASRRRLPFSSNSFPLWFFFSNFSLSGTFASRPTINLKWTEILCWVVFGFNGSELSADKHRRSQWESTRA